MIRRLAALAALTSLVLLPATPAAAAGRDHHYRGWEGTSTSIRPFIGFANDLGVGAARPFGDTGIFLFGADYAMGSPTGFTVIPGIRLGTAPNIFVVTPVVDVAWRFRIPRAPALVPYVGVGVALRMASSPYQPYEMALAFRLLGGVDVWFHSGFGIGLKLVLPEIGPLLTPYVTPEGAVELTIGPRFRF